MTVSREPKKDNYFTKLRHFRPGEAKPKERSREGPPKADTKDPDAAIMKDILECKKQGYTLEEVINVIDDMDNTQDKDRAEEVAKSIYSKK